MIDVKHNLDCLILILLIDPQQLVFHEWRTNNANERRRKEKFEDREKRKLREKFWN